MKDVSMPQEMGKLRTLIVEDDPVQRVVTRGHVARLPALQLVGMVADATEAVRFMNEGDIDLLILDIGLPGDSGYQLLQRLTAVPATIVTTADPRNALEGFERGVVDLLVKPFTFERFVQAVQRVSRDAIEKRALAAARRTTKQDPTICLSCGRRLVTLPVKDLLLLESLGNHVKVHTLNDRLLATVTMKNLEHELEGHGFIRIHRGYIVAESCIQAVEGAQVITTLGRYPLGNLYRRAVLELLAQRERVSME
jgi:two-component system LytT family response regulator